MLNYNYLISCFILKPCPCVSLLAFQGLLCVFPSQCFSVHYLTCPFPTSLTSPVPDPLDSVSVYIVFVLPHVFVSSFSDVPRYCVCLSWSCYSVLVRRSSNVSSCLPFGMFQVLVSCFSFDLKFVPHFV